MFPGTVFLDKALFTSFNCTLPPSEPDEEDPDALIPDLPNFQISLTALLETLAIFGADDTKNSRFSKPEGDGYGSNIRRDRPNAFSNQALGMSGLCRLSYAGMGSPLSIILEESGVTTTCNLNTYEPENPEEIPFQRGMCIHQRRSIMPFPEWVRRYSLYTLDHQLENDI